MKIYLDMCCFNRPYDDQGQARIRLETEAKLMLQQRIRDRSCELVWSSVLDFECSRNPFEEHRLAILEWRTLASEIVIADPGIVAKATEMAGQGIGSYDALHLACALAAGAELLVTTDDQMIRKTRDVPGVSVLLPGDALAIMEKWYEN
jgi:predicted nucleic acid-binding protein